MVAARLGKPGKQRRQAAVPAAPIMCGGVEAAALDITLPSAPNAPRADSVVKERFFSPRQESRAEPHRGQVDRLQKPLQGVIGVDFFR